MSESKKFFVILLSGACAATPSLAQTTTEFSVDAAASVGASTNPYLVGGDNTRSGTATISLTPVVVFQEATGTSRISGNVSYTEFFKRYNASESASIAAQTDQRLSARVSVRGSLGFDTSVVGANDLLGQPGPPLPDFGTVRSLGIGPDFGPNFDPDFAPGTGNVFRPPFLDDITLNGLQQRRVAYSAAAGASYTPDTRNVYSLDINSSIARYPNQTFAADYEYYGGQIGYNRVLSERTNVGVSVGVARSNYGGSFGDATTYSPQINGSTRIDNLWTLSGSIGASFTKSDAFGGSNTSTSLSGSAQACRRNSARANLCLFGSRSAQPSSFDGVRTQTSLGASYAVRLAERSDVAASANYARASSGMVDSPQPRAGSIDYANAMVTYNQRFGRSLRAFVTGNYADIFDDQSGRKANFGVAAGLAYTIGRRR